MRFNTIQEVVEDLKQSKMIILVDDANRENEGDITIAAEKVTPETIKFYAHARTGYIPASSATDAGA